MIAPRRHRKIGIVLAGLVIATLAVPGLAAAETWGPTPGAPAVTYSISGVTLDPPTTRGETRSYTGRLEPSSKLRVTGSGTFHMDKGVATVLHMTVVVAVDGKNDSYSWPPVGTSGDIGGPFDFSGSFDVSVPIPANPQSGSLSIDFRMCNYNGVCDGSMVTGTFTGATPLCSEAIGFFGLDDKTLASTPSGMLLSYDQLNKGFKDAVAAYKQAHGDTSITFSPGTSAYMAGQWLFGYGGGSGGDVAAVRKEFSFTDEKDSKLNSAIINSTTYGDDGSPPDLYTGVYRPPAGSEASLVQDMVRASNNATHKLTPGEVLALALGETGGDGRKAFLLAHNALRGLARGDLGDKAVFGIGTDLKFFDKYLQPMRNGGDNAGVWYHTFGTGFYHLQTFGKNTGGGAATAAEVVTLAAYPLVFGGTLPARLVTKYPDRLLSVLDSVRAFNDNSGLSNLSHDFGETPLDRAAYTSEQAFRENPIFGRNAPDPGKFCYNLYGIRVATEFHNGFPEYRPIPTMTGSTSEGDAPPLSDGTVHIGGSPVDFTWERDGRTLTLDHKTGTLTGDLYLAVIPFYEQSSQTYGAIWVDSPAAPVKVTFKATEAGALHLQSVDPANQLTAYSVPVSAGDSLTYATPTNAKQAALTRADGGAIEPARASLTSDTMARVLLFVAVMGFAVAVVALAWRRRRSNLPAPAAPPEAN